MPSLGYRFDGSMVGVKLFLGFIGLTVGVNLGTVLVEIPQAPQPYYGSSIKVGVPFTMDCQDDCLQGSIVYLQG